MSKICPLMAIATDGRHPDVQPWINNYYCHEDGCAWWTGKQCGTGATIKDMDGDK